MSETIDPRSVETPNKQPDPAANPMLQALLSAMNPDPGGNGASQPMNEMISQLANTDPTLGLIAKYLIAQQESSQRAPQPGPGYYTGSEEPEQLLRIIEQLERQIDGLQTELQNLWDRNDTLAMALGACYLCWGEDSNCPICQGKGHPGSALPEKRVFSRLIMPALHAIKAPKEVHASTPNHRPVAN